MSGSGRALVVLTPVFVLACAADALREPPPVGELTGAEWTLVTFPSAVLASDAPAVTFTVEPDRVSGSGGCNRYFGALTVGTPPGGITIGTLGSTRRMCPPDFMELEGRFLRALELVVSYALVDGELRLLSRDDGQETVLGFAR